VLGAVRFAFGTQLRSRWSSWLIIAVLVSVVGGFVLAGIAAGRRTNAAFPQFVAAHGFDAAVYSTNVEPENAIARLPSVASVTTAAGPDNGRPTCDCARPINPSDFSVITLSQGRPAWSLVAGRLPDPSSPDEVLASVSLHEYDDIGVGSVIHVPFYAASQLAAYNNATGALPRPTGPTVAFHVVGIEASEIDLPAGAAPAYVLYTSPSFAHTVLPKTASGIVYLVRLRHGAADQARFSNEMNTLSSTSIGGVEDEDQNIAAVETSIHPQAIGWWILAALAALVGLAVVGQALARQSVAERDEYPTYTAVGADRRQLMALGLARNLAVAVTGAIGAVLVATALSPVAPVGEARQVEPSNGFTFDVPVLVIGALATVVVVLALGIGPAVRASRVTTAGDRDIVTRPSAVVGRLAAMGAPPSMLIGVRNALQRRSGGTSVPVGTALLGTVLAVVALCGTVVFGTSLTHLTTTPALYGDAFQLNFTVQPTQPNPALESSLRHNPAVTRITRGLATMVSIHGRNVGAVAGQPVRGPLLFSDVSGHLPVAEDEMGLGAATMRQAGARVGSTIDVTVLTPSGGRRTVPFRVVSQVSFPVLGGVVGLGTGALFTIAGYEAAACPPGHGQAACRRALFGSLDGGILVGVVPGPPGQAAVTHYLDADRSITALPITPSSLINFGEAVNFPLIFGGILAIFGAATLTHLMVVSVSRRRREIGLLKVLGFVNGQVVTSVGWQATTVAVVGIVVGVPLGVIAGRATWILFSSRVGAVPVAVVPVALIGLLVVGVLVAANLLAVGPALVATRSKPGRLLRSQ
jgi:hypothetical protein